MYLQTALSSETSVLSTFASFDAGIILTEKIVEGYQAGEKLILCE